MGSEPTGGLLGCAAGLGAVSGLRTFTAAALLGQAAQTQGIPLTTQPFEFLNSPTVANVTFCLAVAELVADKLPFTPARTGIFPLVGRALSGAVAGGAICSSFKRKPLWGALVGSAGAVGAAYAGFFLRRALTKSGKMPDLIVALVEDAIAIAGAIVILRSVDLPSEPSAAPQS